jgi:dephospho-CoA kinase
MERDGVTEADALAAIRAQMPLDEKRRRADLVVENDGSLALLQERALGAWEHCG